MQVFAAARRMGAWAHSLAARAQRAIAAGAVVARVTVFATTSALAIAGCAHTVPTTAAAVGAKPAYLFSYFHGNGDDGVHLAWSADGITWTALNGGNAVITPAIAGSGIGWQDWTSTAALMRDPSIIYGPDSLFHMVWTVAWTDHGIGVASSPDLIHWSPQARVPVMDGEPGALNAWAPDVFYDGATRRYVIVWASAIPGRFPATDARAQKTSRGRADHRLYYVTTADFRTYSPAALLYDGGFAAIDGTITQRGGTYYLVMKDETFYPAPTRNLRIASSNHATGPYGPASPSFTSRDTEGPSVLQTPEWSYIYYDEYTRGRYGAVRTQDFVHFHPFTDSLHAPRMRHGSAFLAPAWVLKGLMALDTAHTQERGGERSHRCGGAAGRGERRDLGTIRGAGVGCGMRDLEGRGESSRRSGVRDRDAAERMPVSAAAAPAS